MVDAVVQKSVSKASWKLHDYVMPRRPLFATSSSWISIHDGAFSTGMEHALFYIQKISYANQNSNWHRNDCLTQFKKWMETPHTCNTIGSFNQPIEVQMQRGNWSIFFFGFWMRSLNAWTYGFQPSSSNIIKSIC